jgi:hypothetical protein
MQGSVYDVRVPQMAAGSAQPGQADALFQAAAALA